MIQLLCANVNRFLDGKVSKKTFYVEGTHVTFFTVQGEVSHFITEFKTVLYKLAVLVRYRFKHGCQPLRSDVLG